MKKIKLGDLCVPSAGQLKKDSDELIDYIDISSVDNETKKVTGYQTLLFEEAPSRARKTVKKGSILVSTVRPNLNAVAMLEEDTPNISVASTGFCVLDSKENVDNRFILNFCKSKTFINAMVAQATGASYPAVSDKIVRAALVPDYTYEEQCNISEVLDKVSNVIEKRKAELCSLDDLIKARFVEMFGYPDINPKGWTECALSEKLNVVGGYAFKSDMFDEDDGIPVLRIGNINSGYFKPVNLVYWQEDKNLERYAMYPGDLVMSLTGTVGKDDYGNVCILGDDYEMYYLNQRNAKLEIKEGIDKFYLSELLKFEQIKKKLTGISRGVRQANISNKDILNLVVPVPPIELQNQFADFVKQIDKSKSAVKKALDETQLLFDSLMQEYFG